LEALRLLGGRAAILDICKKVWELHADDIRQLGDLLYEWQYEIRWAGDILRREGMLRPADISPRGIWELA
jgi:hypothetical protein